MHESDLSVHANSVSEESQEIQEQRKVVDMRELKMKREAEFAKKYEDVNLKGNMHPHTKDRILDNDEYMFENRTGKIIKVEDLVTHDARNLRKGHFRHQILTNINMKGV